MTPLTYRDFPIEMTDLQPDGTFRVRVLDATPGGEMRADEAERPTYLAAEFSKLLGKLERRRAGPEELFALGDRLAGLLLPGRVRTLYEKSLSALQEHEGLRLRLRIEPLALAALPWEYAWVKRTPGENVPADFLALQRKLSLTRYETTGAPLTPLAGKERVRIVVALADPLTDPTAGLPSLNVAEDADAIAAAVAVMEKQAAAVETVTLKAATRDSLLAALPGADIFHFGGHGVFGGSEMVEGGFRRRGQILLEDDEGEEDRYDSDQLAVALGNAGVRLAVLGACSTAQRDEGGAWTGVAPALVRENLPAVVAMQYRVQTDNAVRFIAHLYIRALGGYSVDEAVFEGRQALFNRTGQAGRNWAEDRDWGVPVLYLRAADGVLFPLPPTPVQAGARDEPPLVRAQRKLGVVRGEDIGIRIRELRGGRVELEEEIQEVAEGAKTVGIEIDTVG